MPEEINRVLTDQISTLLLCPTHQAVINLVNEGITNGVHHVGDVMYDAALVFHEIAERDSTILNDLNLTTKDYLLATVHRAENTDDPARLQSIMDAFRTLSIGWTLVFPVHPRTHAKMDVNNLQSKSQNIQFIPPVSFLDMVKLEKHSPLYPYRFRRDAERSLFSWRAVCDSAG
jgi:UDP-GlcNAc3NAcA epimerase